MRRWVGYDRYRSHAALEGLNRHYALLRFHVNFFQPVMKLLAKSRQGAKLHKVYDRARTPYQRLLEAGVLTAAKEQELAAIYRGLNPVFLRQQINAAWERLWALAERATPQPKARTRRNSVTVTSAATIPFR